MSTLRANELKKLDDTNWVGTNPTQVPTNDMIGEQGFEQAVDSVATLRLATFPASLERLWLSGYYGVGTAGGGPLYRDSDDTTTADNGGTVFVDASGVRWKRADSGSVNISEFGATQELTQSQWSAIKAASPSRTVIFDVPVVVSSQLNVDVSGDFWVKAPITTSSIWTSGEYVFDITASNVEMRSAHLISQSADARGIRVQTSTGVSLVGISRFEGFALRSIFSDFADNMTIESLMVYGGGAETEGAIRLQNGQNLSVGDVRGYNHGSRLFETIANTRFSIGKVQSYDGSGTAYYSNASKIGHVKSVESYSASPDYLYNILKLSRGTSDTFISLIKSDRPGLIRIQGGTDNEIGYIDARRADVDVRGHSTVNEPGKGNRILGGVVTSLAFIDEFETTDNYAANVVAMNADGYGLEVRSGAKNTVMVNCRGIFSGTLIREGIRVDPGSGNYARLMGCYGESNTRVGINVNSGIIEMSECTGVGISGDAIRGISIDSAVENGYLVQCTGIMERNIVAISVVGTLNTESNNANVQNYPVMSEFKA